MPISGPNSLGSLTWARDACSRRRYGIAEYANCGNLKQEAIDDALALAHDRIAHERPFQWHRKEDGIITAAPYTTGTVTVTLSSTTVEGAGTPAWTTGNAIIADDAFNAGEGGFNRVASVTDADTLELRTAAGEAAAAGTSYTAARDLYTLPTDFLRLVSIREIDAHQELIILSRGQWASLWTGEFLTGRPRYAVLAESTDSLTSTAQKIQLWPMPDAVYSYQVLYDAFPTWQSTGGSAVPGAPQAMEAFISAALSDLWKVDPAEQQAHEQAYQRAVGQLIQTADRTKRQRIFSQRQWGANGNVWPGNYANTIGTDNG